MEMKFYSPLTAEFFPDEPDWEDESYNEYEGYPMDGHDLLQYADAVDEAVKKDIADFNGDLMQYYHEDDSVRQKVVSAVPSVEIHGNKLCGCLNVELRESLNEGEQAVLCDYISGQYSDGWGEGFEQRDIRVEEGTLAVHFWQEDGFKMTPTFEKTQEQVQMTQRPKMKLLGEDGNIFAIMGRASLLLKNAGQSDKAKEMLRTEVKHYIEVSDLAYSYNKFYAQNMPDKVAWETLQSDLFANLPQIKAKRMPQDFSVVLPKLWRKRQAWDAERTKRPPYRSEER